MAITLDGTDGVTTTGLTSNGIDDNATSTAVTIDSSNNVGIGTNNPGRRLNVLGVDPIVAVIESSTTGAGIGFKDATTTGDNQITVRAIGQDLSLRGAGAIDFITNNLERMRIDSSGNVLVGATSQSSIESGSAYGISFSQLAVYRSSKISTGDETHVQWINPNGVVGAIRTNGTATSYVTASDYRLKENLVGLDNSIDRLKQIPVYRFNFIADPNTTVDGFLAHEVQDVVPEAIHGVKDEVDDEGNPVYQGIDQSKLVPLLVAAVKELEARIATLEAN